jgi:hypothetical protein
VDERDEHHLNCSVEVARILVRPLALAEWWHRLSLDAPTVALVWCWFLARCARVDLHWYSPLVLALARWILYVGDRLLDGSNDAPAESLRERHYFYARNRKSFLGVLVVAFLICAAVVRVLTHIRKDLLLPSCVLGALLCVYFVLIHGIGISVQRWFPKELAVGTLFEAGTVLPTWIRISGKRWQFCAATSLLAGVCWLNCVASGMEFQAYLSSSPVISHFWWLC